MHTAACITTSLCFRVISHSTGCEHHTIRVVLHLEMCIRYTSGLHYDIFRHGYDVQWWVHPPLLSLSPTLWWCHSDDITLMMFFLFLTRPLLLSRLTLCEKISLCTPDWLGASCTDQTGLGSIALPASDSQLLRWEAWFTIPGFMSFCLCVLCNPMSLIRASCIEHGLLSTYAWWWPTIIS